MTKQQVNMRLSARTVAKLEELGELYGTKTKAVEIAIDRLWLHELHEADQAPLDQSLWSLDATTEVLNKFAKNGVQTVRGVIAAHNQGQVTLTDYERNELERALDRLEL